MLTYSELLKITESEISLQNYSVEPRKLYEPIGYILSLGGKRIRPVFTLLACNLFSSEIKSAIPAAIALETFHNFTLIHDDVMDNSPMRRKMPTVHTKWNTNVAILSGDAMSIKAYENLEKLDVKHLPEVLKVFNRTALEVCEGQQYDMDFETQQNVQVDEYLKMIELKTSVLIAACMKIGAIIGGAKSKDADLLYEYGRNIGLAFQLQDDYLDVYGDSAVFGKSIGLDILCNKKTFLLISALEAAKGDVLAKLNYFLNTKNINPDEKIAGVTEIYNSLNVKELSELKISEYFGLANKLLSELSVFERTTELQSFVELLKSRNK